MSALVMVDGLSKRFESGYYGIRDAAFEISAGEVIGILGPSGSGKTTLLSLLGLLDTASAGTLRLCGLETYGLSAARRAELRRDHIGFVFQAFHLVPHLTAVENVCQPLLARGVRWRASRRIAVDWLGRVGLGRQLEDFPTTLSGGEQQRVAVARALAASPSVLLCDEPTGNLDSRNSEILVSLITHAADQESAVVIVTHDAAVAAHCDRVLNVIDARVTDARVTDETPVTAVPPRYA